MRPLLLTSYTVGAMETRHTQFGPVCRTIWLIGRDFFAIGFYFEQSFYSGGGAGPRLSPPVEQALRHFLRGQRVDEVVPPAAVDMEITRPQSFLTEAQF